MMKQDLVPFGDRNLQASMTMVGKSKTPESLATLMPSAAVAAKVGISRDMVAGDMRIVRRKLA
jgi:hypothetical protein